MNNPARNIYINYANNIDMEKKLFENEFLYYPKDFDILNENIFKYLEIKIDDNLGNNCIINDEKIIIKFIYHNKLMLLIGNINNETNKIYIESILYYIDEHSMNNHFQLLKTLNYQKFIKKNISKDEIFLIDEKRKVGKLVLLNKDYNNIKNKQKQKIYDLLNEPKIKQIKLLLYLYFNNERLKYKINNYLGDNANNEKYYLINEDLIKIIKSFYNYTQLIELLEKEFQKYIIQYKSKKNFIHKDEIEELINNKIKILPFPYINSINENNINNSIESLNIINLFRIHTKKYKDKEDILYINKCDLLDEGFAKLIINDINEIKIYLQ